MGIALFGGTFDPYHNGHEAVKQHLLTMPNIHTILLIPNYIAPHKKPAVADVKHRVAMLNLMATDEKVLVSDYEITVKGISWSIDTVEHFKKRYPREEIYYVIGSDSFFDLHTWKEHKRLVSLAKFFVYGRETVDREAYKQYLEKTYPVTLHNHFMFPKINPVEISSTGLRARITDKDYPANLIPEPVLDYIKAHNLYPPPPKDTKKQ